MRGDGAGGFRTLPRVWRSAAKAELGRRTRDARRFKFDRTETFSFPAHREGLLCDCSNLQRRALKSWRRRVRIFIAGTLGAAASSPSHAHAREYHDVMRCVALRPSG